MDPDLIRSRNSRRQNDSSISPRLGTSRKTFPESFFSHPSAEPFTILRPYSWPWTEAVIAEGVIDSKGRDIPGTVDNSRHQVSLIPFDRIWTQPSVNLIIKRPFPSDEGQTTVWEFWALSELNTGSPPSKPGITNRSPAITSSELHRQPSTTGKVS